MNIILYSEYSYRFVSTFSLPFLRQNHRLQFHYHPRQNFYEEAHGLYFNCPAQLFFLTLHQHPVSSYTFF